MPGGRSGPRDALVWMLVKLLEKEPRSLQELVRMWAEEKGAREKSSYITVNRAIRRLEAMGLAHRRRVVVTVDGRRQVYVYLRPRLKDMIIEYCRREWRR